MDILPTQWAGRP